MPLKPVNSLTKPTPIVRASGPVESPAQVSSTLPPAALPPPSRIGHRSVLARPAAPVVQSDTPTSGDVMPWADLQPTLADGKMASVLLRNLWRRNRAADGRRDEPNDLTLYVHLNPEKTMVTAMAVMETSNWREVWSRRLPDGETRRFVRKPGRGDFVFAPDADNIEAQAKKTRPQPEGFTSLDEKLCRNEPLITPADLKTVAPLTNVPVELKNTSPGFAPTPLTPQDLATPPSTERYAGSVDLPEFVGSDTFLPEPPLEMLVAGYGVLAGAVLLGVAASTIEVPSGIVAGVVRGGQLIVNSGRPILAY